ILRLGPDEATALQPFCHQAQPRSIPPQQLEQIAAPSAKDEDVTAQRIARQCILDQSAKTSESLTHVGRTRGEPHARAHRYAAGDDAHRRNSATSARTKAVSSAPVSMRSVAPEASTSCTIPLRAAAASGCAAGCGLRMARTTFTGTNLALAPRLATRGAAFTCASSFRSR